MEQLSTEWFAARCGKVTASRIADLMARTRNGYGSSRDNYMAELLCERLTGKPAERFQNAAMQHGVELEPEARDAYSLLSNADVETVGFVPHPKIPMSGASPDGRVGDSGLVEIKCPMTATHIATLMSESVAEKYLLQMQWQMACEGRKWCDFVSYDNRLPGSLSIFVKRVPRDDKLIGLIETEVTAFLAELDGKLAKLDEIANGRKAA